MRPPPLFWYHLVNTYRHTHAEVVSYFTVVQQVMAKDEVAGILRRGLLMRILANGFPELWSRCLRLYPYPRPCRWRYSFGIFLPFADGDAPVAVPRS